MPFTVLSGFYWLVKCIRCCLGFTEIGLVRSQTYHQNSLKKKSGNLQGPASSFTTCGMIPSPFLVISIVFVYFYIYLLVSSNVFPLGLLNAHSHFTSRQQGGIPHPRVHGAIIAPHPARVRAWLIFLWEASRLLVNVSVGVCLPSLSCEPL